MIKTMIFLAQSFGLEIIAEGVETLEEAQYLLENGCAQIQGYYFYRPMEVDRIVEIFHNQIKAQALIENLEIYAGGFYGYF